MRISVIGSGYVGLVTGTCLADSGNHVTCVDSDDRKVESLSQGRSPIYEPGLEEMMRLNLRSGRLRFTTDLAGAVAHSRVVFIAVGTPPLPDGSADLRNVESVAEGIGRALAGPTVVVTKSTVPVGTGARVEAIIRQLARHSCHVVSNPEFLKEGSAVDDFLRPDRVVIGADDAEAAEIVAELYRPFVLNNKPIIRMSRAASELTKYAANAYLATRISFINEIAAVCEKFDVDVDEVRRGIGTDARIGLHFLYPGVGYGGSCFPKDVQALSHVARSAGVQCEILDAVHRRNQIQREALVQKIVARLGAGIRGARVALWGVSFKPKTDDIREAPAVTIVEQLLAAGASIAMHDPCALPNARALFGRRVEYSDDAYAALSGAAALVIVTEWNEFRSPDFERIRREMRQPLIFDGRNIFTLSQMRREKFEYHSMGRPSVTP
ncbi:MAG: UDP-glucose 6-dehydrogenase [Phycisphaerae bacterium]|nr:UDP-glucose 6-dehydrogenase [Phycisphaerae bacterium]